MKQKSELEIPFKRKNVLVNNYTCNLHHGLKFAASGKRKGKKANKPTLFEDTSVQQPPPPQNYGPPGTGYMDPMAGNKFQLISNSCFNTNILIK